MKHLLVAMALIEGGIGLALLAFPSAIATLLIGSSLETPPAVAVARVGATALLALGVACWLARNDGRSPAASGLVTAMALYYLGAGIVLAAVGFQSDTPGAALWPAVVLHVAMAGWCLWGFANAPGTP